MRKTYSFPIIIKRLQKLGPTLGGVFSFPDLCNLIGASTPVANAKVIKRLTREGILLKAHRGIYAMPDADLWMLGTRIKPTAYISLDSILAKNGLIGTIPAHSVSMVYPGRGVTLQTPIGLIRFFSIKKDFIFGVQSLTTGVKVADNEKAFLDLLYFHTKGKRFVIDPLQEVNLKKLDLKRLKKYLRYYKNPRFVQFVKGVISDVD